MADSGNSEYYVNNNIWPMIGVLFTILTVIIGWLSVALKRAQDLGKKDHQLEDQDGEIKELRKAIEHLTEVINKQNESYHDINTRLSIAEKEIERMIKK